MAKFSRTLAHGDNVFKRPHSGSLTALVLASRLLYPPAVSAQLSDGAKAAVLINNRYSVFPDQIYGRAGNSDLGNNYLTYQGQAEDNQNGVTGREAVVQR
jgi:hypothetical protein